MSLRKNHNAEVELRLARMTNDRLQNKLGQAEHDRDVALDSTATLHRQIKTLTESNDSLQRRLNMATDALHADQLVCEVEAFLSHPSTYTEGGES